MLIFKLALRNLLGAGKRTWLNAIVLSLSFVTIIFYNGMLDGWNQQARKDMIEWEVAQGQYWQNEYDPYDPFTLKNAHSLLPATESAITPILITQATAYPQGRSLPVQLKGIPANQTVLSLPTTLLQTGLSTTPCLLGKRMAEQLKLEAGDRIKITYRDKDGTFDARELVIADIFKSNVPSVDAGQIWVDLSTLQSMTGLENQATLFAVSDPDAIQAVSDWKFQSQNELLKDLDQIIASKKGSSAIIYLLLLVIALLAIFDTQVLSIFRRQKEIGTFIALGMTRWQVVGLFTIEGGANSLFAMLVGSLYGIPLFVYLATKGIPVPGYSEGTGLAIAERIFPVYGLQLVLGTILFITLAATIVSFLPARKIAKMNTTDALKGKLQ